MKKILILIITGVVLSHAANAQKILTVDLDEIKRNIENKSSEYYFPKLLNRFKKGDTALSMQHYKHIYYGETVSKVLSKDVGDNLDKFISLYNDDKFAEAIPYGLIVLDHNPINTKLSYKMMVCYHKMGNKDSASLFADRYYPLLQVISESGDGRSIETAMVVNNVGDEYEILKVLKLRSKGQALIESTDRLTIDQENQTREPKIEALYFNVEIPFIEMKKMFENSSITLPNSK